MPNKNPGIFIKNNQIIYTMDDEIKDEEADLDIKIPPEIEKSEDARDADPESVEELAEEEEEDEEPFDDINPIQLENLDTEETVFANAVNAVVYFFNSSFFIEPIKFRFRRN